MYIYIYIYRERERESEPCVDVDVCVRISVHIYICMVEDEDLRRNMSSTEGCSPMGWMLTRMGHVVPLENTEARSSSSFNG